MGRGFNPAEFDLRAVVGHLGIRLKGGKMPCPFHADRTPSFHIYEQTGYCYGACRRSYTMLQVVGAVLQTDEKSAARWLTGETSEDEPLPHVAPAPARPDNESATPTPTKEKKPKPIVTGFTILGVEPQRLWQWHDADGREEMVSCRYQDVDGDFTPHPGKKQIRYYAAVRWDSCGKKATGWVSCLPNRLHLPENGAHEQRRPLVPLYLPYVLRAKTVVLVEGEKAAEQFNRLAAEAFSMEVIATHMISKTSNESSDEWLALRDKHLIIWPDNDAAGMRRAVRIAKWVRGLTATTAILPPAEQWDEKYDAADYVADGHTAEQLDQLLRRANPVSQETAGVPPMPSDQQQGIVPPPERSKPPIFQENQHYILLGYVENSIYIYSKKRGMVMDYKLDSINAGKLMTMAPLEFWSELIGGDANERKLGGTQVEQLTNQLICAAGDVGIYNPTVIKRRGWCWVDVGGVEKAVLHTGRQLWCDGLCHQLADGVGESDRTVWLREDPVDWGEGLFEEPSGEIAFQIRKCLESLGWRELSSPIVIGGWICATMVGGVLSFRPGLHLQGRSGAGKTHLINKILGKLMDGTVEIMGGNSSTAGVRRCLQMNKNVIMDERQADSKKQREELGEIYQLMRLASGEAGRVIKAGGGGSLDLIGEMPMIGMMMFAATLRGKHTEADANRIAVVELVGEQHSKSYQHHRITEPIQLQRAEFLKDRRVGFRFRHFILRNYRALLRSIEVGRRTVRESDAGVGRRKADLLGTLIGAGVFLWNEGGVATPDEIIENLSILNREVEEAEKLEKRFTVNESREAISTILNAKYRITVTQTNGNDREVERPMYEILSEVLDRPENEAMARELLRLGIKTHRPTVNTNKQPERGKVWVAILHPALLAPLASTQFSYVGYGDALIKVGGKVRQERRQFGGGRYWVVEIAITDLYPEYAAAAEEDDEEEGCDDAD